MTGTPRSPRIEEPVPGEVPPSSVVLMLHGGAERSHGQPHRGRLTYLRMVPFARDLVRAGKSGGVGVLRLRYRYRGWNEPDRDALRDAEWALDEIQRRYPQVRVVLVGHSMGARAALWAAGGPGVVGVCALAPWLTPEDPVEQLAGRTVLIAHGELDRITDPAQSYHYALRARQVCDKVCRFDVRDDGHGMVRRAGEWTSLVRRFALGVLGAAPLDAQIADGFRRPAPSGLLIQLPTPN